ncbi:uncharacterized protein LOC121950634 isoform X2 [Plectropomus leopardus]|uniref:uncharacterized protein LOC121950634 isoform X2 n=1 Tax=Plectropomus leopardus TaxID=160734 RepID=UPI001C4DC8D4|nr:uncharacterized protein LOC121950634 isoform X2 [Plectropomus leopardus]
MTLLYSAILCLFFKTRICQLQCVKETPNDSEFSINVTTHIKGKSGDCILIPYELTFPKNKVTVPYRKIWFRGDPQNTESIEIVDKVESGTKDTFRTKGLPRGEYKYGFKLEWECNQTFVFTKRVHISVSAVPKRPIVRASPMEEGQRAILRCIARPLCFNKATIHWKRTKAARQSLFRAYDENNILHHRNVVPFTPTADDHNTKITCVANYSHSVFETTVTLKVKFSPKIQQTSQCTVEGKLVVCVCISRGNPLPPITWPSLTDFSVTSSSSIQTVNSTITMSAADYQNTSVKCISSNKVGRAEIDIPIQSDAKKLRPKNELDANHKSDANLPWIITAVSLSLNLVLLTSLIICTSKRCRGKSQHGELCEEMKTYATLNKADVGQDYSVISSQTRSACGERSEVGVSHRPLPPIAAHYPKL